MRRPLSLVVTLVFALHPMTTTAQTVKTGVVSALEGNVTAARTALPQPVPLKFKDDVFLRDRITTGDRSLARLLLGGKAVVTLRERSTVTITEVPGLSTVTLDSGKIALMVSRERMQPGERIEVRTPNALAGVRGTVLVAEVTRASAQNQPGPAAATTAFFVFRGSVEAQVLTPAGTMSPPFALNPNDAVVLTGTPTTPPTVRQMTPAEQSQAASGLQASQPQHASSTNQTVRDTVINETTALVNTLTTGNDPPPTQDPTQNQQQNESCTNCPPTNPGGDENLSDNANGSPPPTNMAGVPVIFIPPGSTVNVPGDLARFEEATTLDRPLLFIQDSDVTTGGSLVNILAPVTSTTTLPLVTADPTMITTGSDLFRIAADLSLAGPLFHDIGGTITAPRLLNLSGGAVSVGGMGTLFRFDGTRLHVGQTVVTGNSVSFTNFADLSAFTLNGSTASLGNPVTFSDQKVLRLTNDFGQGGSAFLTTPIPLQNEQGFRASFSTAFQFQMTNPRGIGDGDGQGADGLVFVVQTQASNVGGGGGGIGYDGIGRSVGVEFDTYNNGEPNGGNHVGINLNGSLASVVSRAVTNRLNNGAVWHVWVDYNGDTKVLEVRLSETPIRPTEAYISLSVDLAAILEQPNAFIGFTSGTGAGVNDHDIRSFQFINAFDPIASLGDAGVFFLTDGATITQTGTGPLIEMVGSHLTANGFLLVQAAHSVISLQGSLLRATDTILELTGGLVRVTDGSRLERMGSTAPLVSLTRGSLTVGTETVSGAIFHLAGTATETENGFDEIYYGDGIATDQPLKPGAGTVFEADGTTIDVRGPNGSAFRVDQALLEATAPLISLKGGATMTTSSHTVDLTMRAHVVSLGDAMIKLNASTLTVTNGHLVNVAGASRLSVAGDLLQMTGGSMLNLLNGLLLNVTGGSAAHIAGSLVSFTGAGNVINVTNTLAPTGFMGGVPVFSSLGGTTGFSLSSGTPLNGLNTAGTIKINGAALPTGATATSGITGSLIAIQGSGAVQLGPKTAQ